MLVMVTEHWKLDKPMTDEEQRNDGSTGWEERLEGRITVLDGGEQERERTNWHTTTERGCHPQRRRQRVGLNGLRCQPLRGRPGTEMTADLTSINERGDATVTGDLHRPMF